MVQTLYATDHESCIDRSPLRQRLRGHRHLDVSLALDPLKATCGRMQTPTGSLAINVDRIRHGNDGREGATNTQGRP